MNQFLCLTLVLSVVSVIQCLDSLPPYIMKCSRSDPKAAQCIVDSANAAIPVLSKGDKKYNIPSMQPLKINEISIEPSNNFQMKLKNIEVFGLEKAKVTNADFKQLDDGYQTVLDLDIPDLELRGTYATKGRVLILPIEGEGPCVFKPSGKFKYTGIFERYQKDGVSYLKLKDTKIDLELLSATYKFDNLFNGNKKLGDDMNKFLNENWKEIGTEFNPTIAKTISEISEQFLSRFLSLLPEDVLLDA